VGGHQSQSGHCGKENTPIVCFLLGNSLASEFYMPMFWNTLSVPSSWADRCRMIRFHKCCGIHTGKDLAWITSANRKEGDRVGVGPPVASMWVITLHYLLCNRTHPYPLTLLPIGSGYSSLIFSCMNTTIFLKPSLLHTYLPMKMEQTECTYLWIRYI
jgi:hypothetical protein